LIVLFTAIFTTISVIEDRNEGFLQAVLVAPVPRWTIALGNILGGAAIAWVQTMIFLTLALLTGVAQWSSDMVGVVVLLGIVSLTLTALGLCFAWPMDSTQGFHAVMSLVLLPLWLLSGAFFPVPQLSSQSSIGQWIMGGLMRSNPLSYAIAGLRQLMGAQPSNEIWMPDLATSWIGSCLFLVVTFVAACQIVSRHHR
jgi:ABC-2 type transport system permease protein